MISPLLARTANAVLGFWLFLSAVLLPRSLERMVHVGFAGTVIVGAALAAFYTERARYVSVLAALWVAVSTLVLARGGARWTTLHDLAVAGFVLIFGVVAGQHVPSSARTRPSSRPWGGRSGR